jgi:hypothetical protein
VESVGMKILAAIGIALLFFGFARGPIRYPGATFLLCLGLGISAVFGANAAAILTLFAIGGAVVIYLIYQNRKRFDREWAYIMLFCGGLWWFVFYGLDMLKRLK